ncbi:MAG TPA: capsule assembly Wzi family protein [Geothrix sp.]|nr:capsule assembly Wzi family protein [Geothrix sp.]
MAKASSFLIAGTCAALACASLEAQAPPGWAAQPELGADLPAGGWLGAGLWSADKHGPPAPFVQSLGLGNALTGSGATVSGGWKGAQWDAGLRFMAFRTPAGEDQFRLDRGHLRFVTQGGWAYALEQEPLVWGYGLNGGYVLGEAARPFPKARVSTPMAPRSLFSVPLGSWQGEVFLGRLENHRVLSEDIQDPSYRSRFIAQEGDPQRPFLSGFRARAEFGDSVEFYANWINLFGGYDHGVNRLSGYTFKDYLTAFTGSKDTLIENGSDMSQPQSGLVGVKAKSASNSDVGMRIRFAFLESLLRADDVRFYVSRGSKGENTISFGLLSHRPGYYVGKDLDADWKALTNARFSNFWDRTYRYTAPTPQVPNDVIGILVNWPKWKLGLEYLDTVNARNQFDNRDVQFGFRSFTHADYKTGFYFEGDALGSALGGEARYGTVYVQWDPSPAFRFQSWIHAGDRPFRDTYEDWLLDHPGKAPVRNRFLGLQSVAEYRRESGMLLRLGASTERDSAVLNEQGRSGTGFRWFMDLGWTWSRPR